MKRDRPPAERRRSARTGCPALAMLALAGGFVWASVSSADGFDLATIPGPPVPPISSPADAVRAGDAAAWRGRYCTPLGCAPRPAAPLAAAAGFGLAALGATRLARRTDAAGDPQDTLS